MRSLRGRIAMLATMIALLATSVSALTGMYTARRSVHEQQKMAALSVLTDVRLQLHHVIDALAMEVRDGAVTPGLYEQMPAPTVEWTEANLRSNSDGQRLAQIHALVHERKIVGNYYVRDSLGGVPALGMPISSTALFAISEHPPGSGLALIDGTPFLWATHMIQPKDGNGRPKGVLLGFMHLDQRLIERIYVHGWTLEFTAVGTGPSEPLATSVDHLVSASYVEPAWGGGQRVMVTEDNAAGAELVYNTNNAIVVAGMITALLATLVGIALGFHWVRPIQQLAHACRRRVHEPSYPLPIDHRLAESAVLSRALADLIDAEQRHREELAVALDRETTTNAVQRRFLTQLGHEFGDPLRQLISSIDRLAANDGSLPPEEVVATRHVARLLEERFQEALGLTAGDHEEAIGSGRKLDSYVKGIGELLRPLTQRHGVELRLTAPSEQAVLQVKLLTPLLVNLIANAIAASANGHVDIAVLMATDGGTHWTITDTGTGLPEAVAAALTANGRNYGLEAGLGLGLTLVLANLQALGGSLQVHASGPHGTTLAIDIPQYQGVSERGLHYQTPTRGARHIGSGRYR